MADNDRAGYDPSIGRTTINSSGGMRKGIATENWVCGQTREQYNPRTGKFDLVDSLGRTVGYVPKGWR